MAHWAPFLLVGITAVLLILPVMPALHELRQRHDANPLPTSRHDGRITNFSESLQSRLETCREELEDCRAKREIRRICHDGMELLLVGCSGFDFDPKKIENIDAVMVADAVVVPSGMVVDADVCSRGDLQLREGAVLRAGLSFADILLGLNSSVLRWLHARGSVYLRRGSTVYNRLSAEQSILLESGCTFQRMHAPVIFAVASGQEKSRRDSISMPDTSSGLQGNEAQSAEYGHLFSARPRKRIHGNFVLSAGESLCANVITTGEFRIERGACFFGSAKSYRNTIIEDGASVHGSIACGRTAYVGADSFLTGPLLAEDGVYLSGGSCIGRPDSATTVAACRVRLAAGCRIHGAIWARGQGRVEG